MHTAALLGRAVLVLLVVILTTATLSAQDADEPFVSPPTASVAPTPEPPTVRVRFASLDPHAPTIHVREGDRWTELCVTPCERQLRLGEYTLGLALDHDSSVLPAIGARPLHVYGRELAVSVHYEPGGLASGGGGLVVGGLLLAALGGGVVAGAVVLGYGGLDLLLGAIVLGTLGGVGILAGLAMVLAGAITTHAPSASAVVTPFLAAHTSPD